MNREQKGKILSVIPKDYSVVHIKTTGADPYYDKVISIAAKRYLGGSEVDSFFEEVSEAKNAWRDVIKRFSQFIGSEPMIGYHLNFCINFIYDAYTTYLERPLTNDYLDLKEVLRKYNLIKNNYRLENVCSQLHIEQENGHQKEVMMIERIIERLKKKANAEQQVESIGPFEDRTCVFTGKLQRMDRKAAIQLLEKLGGRHAERVTSKTNYLILGNHDYCSNIESGKSNKQRRAEELCEKGYDIEVISENVYYDLIDVD